MGHHQAWNDFVLNGSRQNRHGGRGGCRRNGQQTRHAIKPAVGGRTESAPMPSLTVLRELGVFSPVPFALI